MLTTCTTEAEHQGGETTLNIAIHMMIGKRIDMIQELQDFPIIL